MVTTEPKTKKAQLDPRDASFINNGDALRRRSENRGPGFTERIAAVNANPLIPALRVRTCIWSRAVPEAEQ